MTGIEDLQRTRIYAEFNPGREIGGGSGLPQLCRELLKEQKKSWPKFNGHWKAVEQSSFRDLDCGDFSVRLQFNPLRIVSSGARVDPASIAARPCFLCPANLPDTQKAILYRRNFLILCNPFPIFLKHFTISSLDHRPQSLEQELNLFLLLARDLAPSLAVFYNGPQSGASAPDHLHFQACPMGSLPIEAQLDDGRPLLPVMKRNAIAVSRVENLGRAVFEIEGTEVSALSESIRRILSIMKPSETAGSGNEPMLNAHVVFKDGKWRVLIFPRRKNRPDLYELEGPDRILVAPGGVEMGGLLVTPVERDFQRMTPQIVRHIYREVSTDDALLERWTKQLSAAY